MQQSQTTMPPITKIDGRYIDIDKYKMLRQAFLLGHKTALDMSVVDLAEYNTTLSQD